MLGSSVLKGLTALKAANLYGLRRSPGLEIPYVHYINGDLLEVSTLSDLPKHVDICIHAAAEMNSEETASQVERTVATNVIRLGEALRLRGVKYTIFCSTIYVYKPVKGTPVNEESEVQPATYYGFSKLLAEWVVRDSGIPYCILRLCSLLDPSRLAKKTQPLIYNWMNQARKGDDILVFGDGTGTRPYLHVHDVTELIRRLVKRPAHGIYNLGPIKVMTMCEIAQAIVEANGKRSKIRLVRDATFKARIQKIDSTKAQKELDFAPARTFEQLLTEIG